MAKTHVKKNDIVTIISGAAKGKSGKVLSVDAEKGRVLVEGVNVRQKTVRRSQEHPQGGMIEVECAVHISNAMLQEKYEAKHGVASAAAAGAPETAEADDAAAADEDEKTAE